MSARIHNILNNMSTENEIGRDSLLLNESSFCRRMLNDYGDNYPKPERILYSAKVLKINKKGREQRRILLITDKALYNLKINKICSCQRRISFDIIESISTSLISNEFTIHCPQEYDYRYKSNDKDRITILLAQLSNVTINKLHFPTMDIVTCTKQIAKQLSLKQRREKLKKQQGLMGKIDSKTNMLSMNNQLFKKQTSKLIKKPRIKRTDSCTNSVSSLNSASFYSCNYQTCLSNNEYYKFLQLIDDKYVLLVNGFIRQKAIKKYKLKYISSMIVDYCLLYSFVIFDAFDSFNLNQDNDFLIITNDKKTVTLGKNNLLKQNIYGSYIVNTDIYDTLYETFIWKLRIDNIDNSKNGKVIIGLDTTLKNKNEYINFGIGGSEKHGFNIWKYNKNIGKMMQNFEKGDWINVILDLSQDQLIFIINCDKKHVIKGINVENGKYRLSVYLSNAQISLKDFQIFQGSFKEFEHLQQNQPTYTTKYFC